MTEDGNWRKSLETEVKEDRRLKEKKENGKKKERKEKILFRYICRFCLHDMDLHLFVSDVLGNS